MLGCDVLCFARQGMEGRVGQVSPGLHAARHALPDVWTSATAAQLAAHEALRNSRQLQASSIPKTLLSTVGQCGSRLKKRYQLMTWQAASNPSLTCCVAENQGLQGLVVLRPRPAVQRRVPTTGTMPSTSPL